MSSSKPFAPYDLTSGWAEPFIGHLVMHFYKIPSALESINGMPGSCHMPEQALHNKPLNFHTLRERLESHFKAQNPSPVMIDDGLYALNIVGIEKEGNNTTLWMADPHIQEGANHDLSDLNPVGLYTVTLDDAGLQIDCSLQHEDHHQVAHMFSSGSYNGLHFESKRWVALFPESLPS